jgi:hypothetical protein
MNIRAFQIDIKRSTRKRPISRSEPARGGKPAAHPLRAGGGVQTNSPVHRHRIYVDRWRFKVAARSWWRSRSTRLSFRWRMLASAPG